MAGYFERTRTAFRSLFGKHPQTGPVSNVPSVVVGENLVLAHGRITFRDPDRAAGNPSAWLSLFEAALERNVPLADSAMDLVRAQSKQFTPETILWGPVDRGRFMALLRPRPGLSRALSEMHASGVLATLMPEFFQNGTGSHSIAAAGNLERLLERSDLAGIRFGTMLRELDAPELVALALLLHCPSDAKEHNPASALTLAQPVLDRLRVEGDTRRVVEFLIESQLQMAQCALRQDTSDPAVTEAFATAVSGAAQLNSLSAEDHLKMLCLLTISDTGTRPREPLSSWKGELIWRLFVDTYNRLTMAYGDEVIDRANAVRTTLHQSRPADISEAELVSFLEGLPQRYLTLFDADTIYQHVRFRRNIGPDALHALMQKKGEVWELTVVTLDRPNLFSNICGTLTALHVDILRGQALTSRNGLVLDVFEFVADARPFSEQEFEKLLGDVIAGRVDIASRLASEHAEALRHTADAAPLLYFNNEYSSRYTILEVVAQDAPGLLFRVSRAISAFGCVVDLVLISTEDDKAIDVFHMTREGAKLTDSDQMALTEQLERSLAASA